jgi:hypothetical protein
VLRLHDVPHHTFSIPPQPVRATLLQRSHSTLPAAPCTAGCTHVTSSSSGQFCWGPSAATRIIWPCHVSTHQSRTPLTLLHVSCQPGQQLWPARPAFWVLPASCCTHHGCKITRPFEVLQLPHCKAGCQLAPGCTRAELDRAASQP